MLIHIVCNGETALHALLLYGRSLNNPRNPRTLFSSLKKLRLSSKSSSFNFRKVQETGSSLPNLKDKSVATKDKSVATKDKSVAMKDKSVAMKDKSVATKDKSVATKDKSVAMKDKSVAMKDKSVATTDKSVAMKDWSVGE